MGHAITQSLFPSIGNSYKAVLDDIDTVCNRDHRFQNGKIFNSICSEPLPIAADAYMRTVHTNLADNRIFPGMRRMEERLIGMLGNLLGCDDACGNIVSGGTEANLLSMAAAIRRSKSRRIYTPEIIAPFSVHYSIHKIAELLGINLRLTMLDRNYRADVEDIERNISPATIAIIATAGTSELGAIDDIERIARVASQRDLYFHVDAASGGFLIPFANHLGLLNKRFDFRIEGVHSITIDPHKFGLSVIPSGCIIFRSRDLHALNTFESHYVGTLPQRTLSGTRPGAAVASTYAVLSYLGMKGFCDIVSGYYARRDYLISGLRSMGYELLVEPELTIVAPKMRDARHVLHYLEGKGWITSLSRRNDALRIVIHNHITNEHIDALLEQLELSDAGAKCQ